MLVYNKYLKELGIKENEFPFDKTSKEDPRYGLDKKSGVVDAQTFSMDYTIVMELYTYLRYFQDNCMIGVPAGFIDETEEDSGMSGWAKVVQEIVDGLKGYVLAGNMSGLSDEEQKEVDQLYRNFDKAWALLGKHFQDFWW